MIEENKKGVWKQKIENFIEQKNGIIQICFFTFLLICSGIFLLGGESYHAIILELLTLISAELLNLNIKDSIAHRKLNRMSIRLEMEAGSIIRMGDFDLNRFFQRTQDHFFVSGIASNFFLQKYENQITQLLDCGKKIYIMLVKQEFIEDCTKLYCGISLSDELYKKNKYEIINKQIVSLNCISNPQKIFNYFENGQLQLRMAKNVLSTSFVAYDVFDNSIIAQIKRNEHKEIKASFYQYACPDTTSLPNIVVNSKDNENWYKYFSKTIYQQWKDADVIDTKEKLESTINELTKELNILQQ